MENQWAVPLPEVQETSEGEAPDELIVYACDIFPYRKDDKDITTWLPREDVSRYVQTELVRRMIEVFRLQTDDWAFPWHDALTSLHSWEDAEQELRRDKALYHALFPQFIHRRCVVSQFGQQCTGVLAKGGHVPRRARRLS